MVKDAQNYSIINNVFVRIFFFYKLNLCDFAEKQPYFLRKFK